MAHTNWIISKAFNREYFLIFGQEAGGMEITGDSAKPWGQELQEAVITSRSLQKVMGGSS